MKPEVSRQRYFAKSFAGDYFTERLANLSLEGHNYHPSSDDAHPVRVRTDMMEDWITGDREMKNDTKLQARSQFAEVWARDLLRHVIRFGDPADGVPLRAILTPQTLDEGKHKRGADILIAKMTKSGYKPLLFLDVTLMKKASVKISKSPLHEELFVPVLDMELSNLRNIYRTDGQVYSVRDILEQLRVAVRDGMYKASYPLTGDVREKDFWYSVAENVLHPAFVECRSRIERLRTVDEVRGAALAKLEEGRLFFRDAFRQVLQNTPYPS